MNNWMIFLLALLGAGFYIISLTIMEKVNTGKYGNKTKGPERRASLFGIGAIAVGATALGLELLTPGMGLAYSIFIWATVVIGLYGLIPLVVDVISPGKIDWEASYAMFAAVAGLLSPLISLIVAIVHIWVPFR